MTKMFTTTIKVQKEFNFKMQQRIINDGYGMRGKTRWIIEAIENLFSIPNYLDFVDIADDAEKLDEIISVRVPSEIHEKLENALIQVRVKFPAMEGVKSKLIRASIMQRLFRG